MKIYQINAIYGTRSTGVIVKDIDEMLRNKGDESYVACINGTNLHERVYTMNSRFESMIHAGMTRLSGTQGFWSRNSTKNFLKTLTTISPDVIHIHNLHSNFINLPLLLEYCAEGNIPLVVTLHDCWYFTGKCYHFADIGCDKWKTICDACPKRRADIPSILVDMSKHVFQEKKRLFNSINKLHVVGCSHWITDKAKQSPIFSNATFHTIRNGVETQIFRPDETPHKSQKFNILVMANKWFLNENLIVRERLLSMLDKDMMITVAGCSETQMKENSSNDRIKFVGYSTSRQQLAGIYNAADVFLNMTLIDTLPTVNMESICCGTPVITYNSGGSPELVEEDVTGYIVDQLDSDAIIDRIRDIRGGALSRQICSEKGRMEFDKDVNYKKYLSLYNNILHV